MPFFKRYEYAMIDGCVVDEHHRFKGIGSLLMNAARDWTKERGLEKMQLSVWANNEVARAFYRKQGFEDLIKRMELRL